MDGIRILHVRRPRRPPKEQPGSTGERRGDDSRRPSIGCRPGDGHSDVERRSKRNGENAKRLTVKKFRKMWRNSIFRKMWRANENSNFHHKGRQGDGTWWNFDDDEGPSAMLIACWMNPNCCLNLLLGSVCPWREFGELFHPFSNSLKLEFNPSIRRFQGISSNIHWSFRENYTCRPRKPHRDRTNIFLLNLSDLFSERRNLRNTWFSEKSEKQKEIFKIPILLIHFHFEIDRFTSLRKETLRWTYLGSLNSSPKFQALNESFQA